MATTTLAAAEAQARRHAATTPDRPAGTVPAPQQRAAAAPAGLSTASLAGTRGRAAADPPEAGDGQTPYATGALFGPGGNMLNAWALDVPDGQDSSMRVVFTVPGLVGGCVLDVGDGSEPIEFNSAGGSIEHEYDPLPEGTPRAVFDAVCRDEHQRLRGWIRFAMPHTRTLPQDLRSGHPASRVV